MPKRTRRTIAERIAEYDKRIAAASKRLETLKLIRQVYIEGQRLKSEKALAELGGSQDTPR